LLLLTGVKRSKEPQGQAVASLLDNYLWKAKAKAEKGNQREVRAQGTRISGNTLTPASAFPLLDNFT